MSECVVRMKMPHDGLCDLAFSLLDRTCCTIEGNLCNYCDDGVIPKWCPIICELPEGHGRLVDVDEDVSNYITVWDCNCSEFGKQTVMAVDDMQYLPTIVPAERSET